MTLPGETGLFRRPFGAGTDPNTFRKGRRLPSGLCLLRALWSSVVVFKGRRSVPRAPHLTRALRTVDGEGDVLVGSVELLLDHLLEQLSDVAWRVPCEDVTTR